MCTPSSSLPTVTGEKASTALSLCLLHGNARPLVSWEPRGRCSYVALTAVAGLGTPGASGVYPRASWSAHSDCGGDSMWMTG